MRVVLQRVKSASVKIDNKIVGEISDGFLIFLGVKVGDSEKDADWLAEKILKLRLFDSDDHSTFLDKNIGQVTGGILVVSQFTLYGDARKGTRPEFIEAARPELAEKLYNYFVEKLKESKLKIETGKFREEMQVELVNDGPVTIIVESP